MFSKLVSEVKVLLQLTNEFHCAIYYPGFLPDKQATYQEVIQALGAYILLTTILVIFSPNVSYNTTINL